MFSLFRNSYKEIQNLGAAQELEGTEFRYYPNLIKHLKKENQSIIALYQDIDKARMKGNHEKIGRLLSHFGSELRGHLIHEHIKLYIYLKFALKEQPENLATLQKFRSEMMQIGKNITEFLSKYENCSWNNELLNSFDNEFERMGQVLIKRIQTEEEMLYPLYLPPSAYS